MANHQTVKLSRGAHSSPEKGVCVMELASMLAGEKFNDRPASVSPLIARFLRVYNDRLENHRRQDLIPYASRVVGTRASRGVERTRARLCVDWMLDAGGQLPWLLRVRPGPSAGVLVAKHAARDGSPEAHEAALSLLDELIACGDAWAGTPSDVAELIGRERATVS